MEIEFTQREVKLNCIPVPSFQELEQVRGDWSAIERRIKQLRADHSRCWLEVLYEGETVIDRLPDRLEDLIAGSSLEILRVQNRRLTEQVLRGAEQEADLAELDPEQVFRRCLELHQVPAGQQPELIDTYREVLVSLELDDRNQE